MNLADTISGLPEPGQSSQWGWLAIVFYVPDPQKALLSSLRKSLPGRRLPPVHITVLPPRPLPFSIDEACIRVEDIIHDTTAFEVGLSEVRFFSQTDFLYLDIAAGKNRICDLHEKLNAGDLSHPEIYEFRPHLTLGGPIPRHGLQAFKASISHAWQKLTCDRHVLVNELICLWLHPAHEENEWIQYRSFLLKKPPQKEATNQKIPADLPLGEASGHSGF